VSKSWLDRLDRSPAHLRAYLDGYRPDSPAMALGRLTHVAILEPDLLDELFVTKPADINRRTNAGKAEFADWERANAHKSIVTADQLELARAMRDSVRRNKAARALLTGGDPEETVVWRNLETGELCKARADWLRENVIVDVKTTQDARPEAFARSIANFRYDRQVGHYSDGFNLDKFVFVVVESMPPHGVAVYAADSVMHRIGREARDENLRVYAECKATDNWPGYPDVISEIQLPSWAMKQHAS
jgi:exodeoxyribonuclease VIII